MRIRTQLVLAFLLLSVVPLAVIVLYSYYSSLHALRTEYQEETATLTSEMDHQVARIKDDLKVRVNDISSLPSLEQSTTTDPDEMKRLLGALGDQASLVDELEVVPATPPVPAVAPPAPPSPSALVAPPAVAPSIAEPAVAGEETPDEARSAEDLAEEQRAEAQKEAAAERLEARRVAAGERAEVQKKVAEQRTAIEKMQVQIRRDTQRAVQDGMRAARIATQQAAKNGSTLNGRPFIALDFEVPIIRNGAVVGKIRTQLSSGELLRRVWASRPPEPGDIPFAIDGQGNLYASDEANRSKLLALPLDFTQLSHAPAPRVVKNWVVAASRDPGSGLTLGIARPMRQPLIEVQKTAAKNFAFGIGLVLIALVGVVPLANRLTGDLQRIAAGAERIAAGDLTTRVTINSKSELGQLASAFNRMARDLSEQRGRLVEQVRLRQEQEMRERLLTAEYDRKSEELEEARRFQLSLLPKTIPQHSDFDLAVYMKTATEVGGDYYDFHLTESGVLTIAVGDATGHGARAGTMVTVIKSLFSTFGASSSLPGFLDEAAGAIRRMELGRMAMALVLCRIDGNLLTVASAGMPPVLIRRRETGKVEEMAMESFPLGSGVAQYAARTATLSVGDSLLLLSDGLPELLNPEGDPIGYVAIEKSFALEGHQSPKQLIDGLIAVGESWSRGEPLNDDVTMVAWSKRA